MTTNNEQDCHILSVENYRSAKDRSCAWSRDAHIIRKGHMYKRVVYEKEGQFFQDHICIQCWVGDGDDKA